VRKLPLLGAVCAAALLAPKTGSPADENPFFSESTLPFHLPPFDRIKESDYLPAYEKGMADQLREVEAIAANPDKPTFENTILALEKSGRVLARVSAVFDNVKKLESDETMRKIERIVSPEVAAHEDAIHQNTALFARIDEIYRNRATLGLDPESVRLVEHYHLVFIRAGAQLSVADQAKLRAYNAEIASLSTEFRQNVLTERNDSSVFVTDRSELDGLSDAAIASLEAAAKADNKPGAYEIRLINTTGQDAMTSLTYRPLRQAIMEHSLARGSRGGSYDNEMVVERIADVRAERANLLGFATHGDYQVADQTAGTEAAVEGLLAQLVAPAVAKAKREAADMQALIDQEHGGFQLEPWDWQLYAEKVRKARFAFDDLQLKPYFELNHVLTDGVFFAAHRLYGVTFKERRDLPVYEADVRVFEVDDVDGKPLALLLEDFYARPSKQGGAWMDTYVRQSFLHGDLAVVANHHNIQKPEAGQPTLLTFDQVVTLFHEFGHGLHGMFSRVNYPSFSGTAVPRDFVEYPSQVNEMWAAWPEVVRNYARDYKTGERMPQELIDKMLATRKFNQGFATTEYLKATLLDQAWYTLKPGGIPTDIPAFEQATFAKYGAGFAPVPPRYRSTYFSHVFEGNYSAEYYSYIWADVLVADSIEWFKKNGGLTRENGDRFRSTVLSHGASVAPMTLFHQFTGTDPEIGPLLRLRGLDEGGN